MYQKSQRIEILHNALTYMRAQAKVAQQAKITNETDKYRSTIRSIDIEIEFMNMIGLINSDKDKLLRLILNRMIESI